MGEQVAQHSAEGRDRSLLLQIVTSAGAVDRDQHFAADCNDYVLGDLLLRVDAGGDERSQIARRLACLLNP